MSLTLQVVGDTADRFEREALALPQVECPLVHHFGPGIYIREVTIPAGTFVVGHRHKQETLNILQSGRLVLMTDDGTREMRGPYLFTSPPGRKVAYAATDVVFQNVFATEERDIAKLEAMFVEKSEQWLAHDEAQRLADFINSEACPCLS